MLLQVLDAKWKDHLYALDNLKEGIGLRAYGQRNPLVEYKKEAFDLFQAMTESIKHEGVQLLYRVQPASEGTREHRSVLSDKAQFLHPESAGVQPQPDSASLPPGAPPLHGQRGRQAGPIQPVKRSTEKVGRNEPCSCGSGKKYKKCCGVNDA